MHTPKNWMRFGCSRSPLKVMAVVPLLVKHPPAGEVTWRPPMVSCPPTGLNMVKKLPPTSWSSYSAPGQVELPKNIVAPPQLADASNPPPLVWLIETLNVPATTNLGSDPGARFTLNVAVPV